MEIKKAATSRSCRFIVMMILTGTFFIVEIVVGHLTKSIALIADSFHMLSDILSLIVALTAVKMAKKASKKNTFGWIRAEVLGALINSVFLLALCFTIVIDAIKRMIQVEKINDVNLLLIVGAVGLFINLIGMCLFYNFHGTSLHGHTHEVKEQVQVGEINLHPTPISRYPERALSEIITDLNDGEMIEKESGKTPPNNKHGLNMKGVFLHIFADALGSIVIMISGVIIKFAPLNKDGSMKKWIFYVDPVLSLIMICFIVSSTIPLFKESALILLQTVPNHINVLKLRENLLLEVPEIEQVHDLHVWQLSGNKIIGSAHVKRKNLSNYMTVASSIKQFFHKEGIHSTTIQVECDGVHSENDTKCLLSCQTDECIAQTCCGKNQQHTSNERV